MGALASDDQQLFITTHSTSALNRLGIEALQLLGPAAPIKLDELSTGTVGYFKKLPGFDTLRLVLRDKIVLVEGPSDEIIFERVFADLFGKLVRWPRIEAVDAACAGLDAFCLAAPAMQPDAA